MANDHTPDRRLKPYSNLNEEELKELLSELLRSQGDMRTKAESIENKVNEVHAFFRIAPGMASLPERVSNLERGQRELHEDFQKFLEEEARRRKEAAQSRAAIWVAFITSIAGLGVAMFNKIAEWLKPG